MACLNHPGIVEDLIVCWRCRRAYCHNCTVELQSYYFCPECKPLQVRDMLAGTDMATPDYAHSGRRLGGWLLDGLLKFAVAMALNVGGQLVIRFMLSSGHEELAMVVNVMLFVFMQGCEVAYETLMLTRNNGQTLGKMAVGIRVVTVEGNPISMQQALTRAGIRSILNFSFCACGCIAWLLDGSFAFGPERATLHDMAAQTRVINNG